MKKSTEKNAAETTAKFVIPETYWHKFVVGNKVAEPDARRRAGNHRLSDNH